MKKLELPVTFHAYQVAHLYVDKQKAKTVLGEPHYIETDSTRTFGGDEALWAYDLDGEQFCVVCRIPYEESVIYSKEPRPKIVFEKLRALFPEADLEIYDEPHKI